MLWSESYHYSTWHRLLEVVGLLSLAMCCVFLSALIVLHTHTLTYFSVVLSATFFGYLGADFISGFVHWLGDRYGCVDTPLLGANFVRPFREHHNDPQNITRHDFIETNGNNSIVTVPLVLLSLFLIDDAWPPAWALFCWTSVLSLSAFVFMTNQFHKWAHSENRPALATWLQDRGWILHPEHHALHHTPPFDTYYCITTGWLNKLLFKLKFFPIAEWIIGRGVGVRAGVHGAYAD